MSGPFVYVERDPSGQVLTGLRLIGESGEERYSVPGEASPVQAVTFAAEWLRSRLDAHTGSGIGILCLDPRGSVCSWLDVPSEDDSVVRAAVRQKPSGTWGEWASTPALESMGTVEALVPTAGSSLQPIGVQRNGSTGLAVRKKAETESRRAAVIGVSDLPVKLLLDALDEMRIDIGRVVTFWQAMALAWDPSGERVDSDDPLVSSAKVDTAVVLVEETGRVQWTWSSEGSLVAAGSSLLEEGALSGDDAARNFGAGRLAVDWLAWTAQLGRSPRRVICLIDESQGSPAGVGAFGEAVTGVWPGAAVDLLRVDDPVFSTMTRLSERTPGGKLRRDPAKAGTVNALAGRPGRTHRAMYRWMAGAIALGAVALGIAGYRLRSTSGEAEQQAVKIRNETRALILSELGNQADQMYPEMSLQSMLGEAQQNQSARAAMREVHPVLQAIDDVQFVVGSAMSGVEINRLVVDQPALQLDLITDTTEQAETAQTILNGAMEGFVRWNRGSMRSGANGKTRVSITGYWVDSANQEPGS